MPTSRRAVFAGTALAVTMVLSGCGSDEQDGASGEGASESAPQAKLLNKVPMAKVSEMAGAMGMWATDKNFVKADLKKIVGYPLDGGAAQWTVPLGGELCWSSPEPTKDGLIAVVFENDKEDPAVCTEVGLVDLKRGKLLWQKQAMEDGSEQMFDEVTIGGGTVAAEGPPAPRAGRSAAGRCGPPTPTSAAPPTPTRAVSRR